MDLQRKARGPAMKASLRKPGPQGRRQGEAGTGKKSVLLAAGFGKSSRLVLAGLLFAASTWWALTRFSRPDPFRKPSLLSWSWWTHPLEVNAPARLPVVSGTLTSLAVADRGAAVYVAGQQGLLIRYRSSSQEWESLHIPESLAEAAPAWPASTSRTDDGGPVIGGTVNGAKAE